MARQKGIIQLTGRIDRYVGYMLNGKFVMRSLPEKDTEKFRKDPKRKETLKTGTEFGQLSSQGKFMRELLRPFTGDVEQKQLDSGVNSFLSDIRMMDTSERGKRTISGGLRTAGAAETFVGFEFHEQHMVRRLLQERFTVNKEEGSLCFAHFAPKTSLKCKKRYTHVQLSLCAARIDFEELDGEVIVSEVVEIEKDAGPMEVELVAGKLKGKGLMLLVLKVVFVERFLGKVYVVEGGGVVVDSNFYRM